MIEIHHGDKVVLKALNIPGLVCQKGRTAFFQKMEGLFYRCTLNYTDPEISSFIISERDILQAFDNITGKLIYKHDMADGL